jgi:hypothetical protein
MEMQEGKRTFLITTAWMTGLTLVLFFLPVINGFSGGAVGGYFAGDRKRAIADSGLSIILVSLVLGLAFSFAGEPVLGLYAKSISSVIILMADAGIVLGALFGGMLRELGQGRRFFQGDRRA